MPVSLTMTRAWAANGLATYLQGEVGRGRATDWQQRFHRDQARHRAVIKGNQVGGSRACAAETWMQATGTHPWRRVNRAEGLLWVTVANWSNGYHAVCKNMYATCPTELVDWGRSTYVEDSQRWVNDQILLRDGFKIEFRPSSGSSLSTASATLDGLWIDEPPSRSQWGELHQRVKRWQAPVWLDCTPIDKSQDLTWLKHELVGDIELNIRPRTPWSVHNIRFTAENCPWMSAQAVAEERAKVGAEEAGARNDGEWEGESVGRIFRGYNPPLDALPFVEAEEADYWHVGVGIDWGEGAGKTAAIIVAWRINRARLPEFRVLGEYHSQGTTSVPDDASAIVGLLATFKLRISDVERWVGDTNTLGKASPGRRINGSLANELQRLHLAATGDQIAVHVDDAVKITGAPATGVMLMQQAFSRGLLHVDAARCPILDRALRRWEGADDDYKHPIDALRYMLYPFLVRYIGTQRRGQGANPPR